MQAKGFEIEADRIRFDLDAQTGDLYSASVQFDGGYSLYGDYLQRVDLINFRGEHVKFSACPEDSMAWEIVAEEASLNSEQGTFAAKKAWFEWGGVPVLYIPRWEHALIRRSGLLMPELRQSTRRGSEIVVPFYWAAAPNWDMTISPHWMSLRGVMHDVEWRHRSKLGSEMLQLRTVFDEETRQQRSRLLSDMAWSPVDSVQLRLNIDVADDSYHVADFPLAGESESVTYLKSDAVAAWRDNRDSATLGAHYQQVLGGVSNSGTLQVIPRLQTINYFDAIAEQGLKLEHQTTVFRRDVGHSGLRAGIRPSWSLPWTMFDGALSADWTLLGQFVGYETKQFGASQTSYGALASSLEVETAFERVLDNRQWRHEIKPVIRIDMADAPDQSLQPRYDSSLIPLQMHNLMTGNRYSGWDRFERMSRISMLLVSSMQQKEEQGGARTVVQGSLGMVWDHLQESVDAVVDPAASRRTSNLLLEAAWLPGSGLSLDAGGQHDPDLNRWPESHAGIHWVSREKQYFHLLWQRTDASYAVAAESMSMNAAVQFGQHWSSSLSSQYDLLRQHTLGSVLGISYQHACWNMTLETFQTYQVGSSGDTDNGARLLLAFDGLGSFGDK